MGPFEVTKEIIKRLSDEQLRELLRKLLEAEARMRGIPNSCIAVGGNQRAADAGVDASIRWTDEPAPMGWLPRQIIYFQCKAENMPPRQLKNEMRPGDIPRSIFTELSETSGAYIVFSTDDPSHSAYQSRLSTMGEAVADVPNHEHIFLDFYGADRIARWTNEHLGVAIWALEHSGRILGGWRPFESWSAPHFAGEPYLIDDTERATLNGEETDIPSVVTRMRQELASPGKVVRLVGISGTGKTRLAEALFDERIEPETALPPSRAIYGDASRDLATSPALLVEQFVRSGVDAVIVVDNCDLRTHRQLAEIVGREESGSSLLTIDYDVGDDVPNDTIVVSLGGISNDTLEALLTQRFPRLNEFERDHLAEFSGGNARIALQVAKTAGEGVDLSKLSDNELLDRLFQTGRQESDTYTRRCAEAASLVYAFYIDQGDNQEPEHPLLAELANISADEFYRQSARFLDWGIVQKRGPQRAVMPPPLANRLAREFIHYSDPTRLLDAFLNGPPRLLASFARRLGQLHDESVAVGLVKSLFGPDGIFGDLTQISDTLRRGFINAASAAPETALAAIERALASPNASVLTSPNAPGRYEYSNLLVHIAYDEDLFARAMEAQLAFVLASTENQHDQQIRWRFLGRFWPILSFTKANLETRLRVVDRLLDDPDEKVHALGIDALDHMFKTGHFTSSVDPRFGARPRMNEWRPASYQKWFEAAYERAIRIATSDSSDAERAQEIIARHFREHITGGTADLCLAAMRRVGKDGFWDAGWRAVTSCLHFDREAMTPELLAEVEALERELHPKSPEQCFEAFVLGEPWQHYHPSGREKLPMRNVGLLARAVGCHIVRSGEDIEPYLGRAVAAEGRTSVRSFARGLAQSAQDLDQLWNAAYVQFAANPPERRHFGVLAGIMEGAAGKNPDWVERKLDVAVADPTLSEGLVMLHAAFLPLNSRSMERFSSALEGGSIPPRNFLNLKYGGVTKTVPPDALAQFLSKLFQYEEGVLPALEVLHMRIFGDNQDGAEIAPELVAVARQFLADSRSYAGDQANLDRVLTCIAKPVLINGKGYETAIAVCHILKEQVALNNVWLIEFDDLCMMIMKLHPKVVLDELVANDVDDSTVRAFFGGYDRDNDDTDNSKIALEDEAILSWAGEDPDQRILQLARVVPYTVTDKQSGEFHWSTLACKLIGLASDPTVVLNEFERRFFTGGGSGTLSSRFVRRRPLIQSMLENPDPRVRNWARAAERRLEDMIQRWEDVDHRHDSRFE